MPSKASSANTTSADQVLLSFRAAVAGDGVQDDVFEELVRRLIAEVDSSARNAPDTAATGRKQVFSAGLAIGAQELTFTWSDPFPDTHYGCDIYPTSDPGAALRIWVKSKSTTKIVYGIVGATVATTFNVILLP